MTNQKYSTFTNSSQRQPSQSENASAPRHPHSNAPWYSRVFLSWVTPLIRLGNEKQLDEHEVWPLKREHQAAHVAVQFSRDFSETHSIPRSFLKSFGGRFALTGLAFLIAMLANLFGPVVLHHVLTGLASQEYDLPDLTTWIFALFCTEVVQALADNYANFDSELMSIQFTSAIKNAMYQKTLRLNAKARKQTSTGAISNMYITDCTYILLAGYYIHQLWVVPLQILIAGFMLYQVLGLATFAGLFVVVLLLLANNSISSKILVLHGSYMELNDARMKRLTEVFKAISIVKLNAWEDKMIERIGKARAQEVANIWQFLLLNAANTVLTWGMPVFICVVAFGVHTALLKRELTPAIVFTSLSLFQLIQVPLRGIATTLNVLVRANVSAKRLGDFLQLPELGPDSVLTVHHPSAKTSINRNAIISIENGDFGWDEETLLLRNVNLQVKTGEFVVVHGRVGSGKSSFCSALLGEMLKRNGKVHVGGSVAYCSQQPWIQNMTVRDNILFGLPYDHKKYEKVLEACALTKDLRSLPAGDNTEIGERGVNLSGGQKARVALARACYANADVYILDAPLAAVDAIVQNEIFQKCLLGLLRGKTIILVTHSPEIIASSFVNSTVTIDEECTLVKTDNTAFQTQFESEMSPLASFSRSERSFGSANSRLATTSASASALPSVRADENSPSETNTLVKPEQRKKGRVGLLVFTAYYRAVGGLPVLLVVLLSQVLWQTFQISSDFWLSKWSTDAVRSSSMVSNDTEVAASTQYRMTVYVLLGLSSAFMILVRTLTVCGSGLNAAKTLFNRMTNSLIHAPMSFFDANPSGRILTRYTSDITSVDFSIPILFGNFFANLFSVGCSLVTAAVIIQWNGIFLLPVCTLYLYIGALYLDPAREIERLYQTTWSPIISHLSATIEGGSVIRAFGTDQLRRFNAINDVKLDTRNKIWFAKLAVSRWFALRIQLIGSLLVFVVAYSLILLHNQLSPAIIGLAFAYMLKISQSLELIIQSWSKVETEMVCPERLQEYIDVPQEAPARILTMDPPSYPEWPSTGSLQFHHVSFRYKPSDPLVLKDVSFSVNAGEKVGIVGRTGAGKSSLTMALFRISEIASGSIIIDGVDVGKIGLKTLREKLSIIPQNPVLFKGTVRNCLDPFNEYSDDALWDSIRNVGLSDRLNEEAHKLEYAVDEDGENFSVGERQMLCMARALLRHSRIVIFDEATAAIDRETDKRLQHVIRTAFAASTVLTIAHRLDTVLDSDRILVLDGGQAIAFAPPQELVQRGEGLFCDLIQESGLSDSIQLVSRNEKPVDKQEPTYRPTLTLKNGDMMRSSSALWRRYAVARATTALRAAPRSVQRNGSSAICRATVRALSVRQCGVHRAFSSAASAERKAVDPSTGDGEATTLALLENSITLRDPIQALAYFDRLQKAKPSQVVAQRLAILLAKKGESVAQITRAQELLKSVYMLPALQIDDYTKLASIYVVDACLRHNMIDEAVEIYEEALNAGVVLDLPAYDALLKALVEAGQVDDAVAILKELVAQNDVSPTQQTYAPLLMALMERFEYDELIGLIDDGRKHGIIFTMETYDPLVDLGEQQQDDLDHIDGLEKFMVYVNEALEEDGLLTDFDDDDITIEYEEGDDDDDDQDFDHDDGDDEFSREMQLLRRALGRHVCVVVTAPERRLHHRQTLWRPLNRRALHSTASLRHPAAVAAANDVTSERFAHTTELSPQLNADAAVAQLEECIAQRDAYTALARFKKLETPPSTLVMQKLAILLAKQKQRSYVVQAYEILQSVYRLTGLAPDDYTQLASIHVVDACLQHRMLDQAVETYEEAFNQGVFLDLPAIDALLQALVDANRTEEAVAILHEIADENEIAPSERSYFPMLLSFADQREYESATALLEKGQGRGVTFTNETFHSLVELAEKDEEPSDALVVFLSYIEDIWEDAKLFDELAELEDGDDDDDYQGDDDDRDSDNERV
ncbi:Multidrug resistance-associated protein 1, partial [Globisporangium splendens]